MSTTPADGSLIYCDTSALVKLIVPEQETRELFRFLADAEQGGRDAAEIESPSSASVGRSSLVTSDLAVTELYRVTRRTAPERMGRVTQVLETFYIARVTPVIFRSAALLDPSELKGLDALQLAAALSLAEDLASFVCYDHQLANAARHYGLNVAAPGRGQ